jgi:ABC-2 type transport system permease protein
VSTQTQLARVRAISRRDWRTERSYTLKYVLVLLQLVFTMAIVYHLAKFVIVDPSQVGGLVGTYFDYAVVGLAVMSIAQLGIGTFNNNIMREQALGTLEVLFATPTPLPILLAGSFVFPMLLTGLELFVYLVIGIGVLGSGLTTTGVLFAIPVLILTLVSFCSFGIVSASIVVIAKRGDPISAPLLQLTAIISGALFPIEVLPWPIEKLAHILPAYYGIEGLREALLGQATWSEVGPNLAVLAGFCVVLLPLSVMLFGRSLAEARRLGTLGNY